MTGIRVVSLVLLMLLAAGCAEGEAGPSPATGDPQVTSEVPTSAPTATGEAVAIAGPVDLGPNVNGDAIRDLSGETGQVVLALKLDDADGLLFDPTYVKVPPGAKVAVKLDNVGFIDHNFSVDSMNIDKDVASEAKAAVKLTMPDDTAVRFYCDLHSGMAGALYSEEGQDVES